MLSPKSDSRPSGTLPPESWQRIEELYLAALEHAPEARSAWLTQACPDNDALRHEVESLLAADGRAGDFLERRVSEQFSVSFPKLFPGFGLGHQIGSYRLVREIGQGGMGAVYMAERTDGEFHQRVAIKLVRQGFESDFLLRRFRHEREILARLEHPNIARLLDGGTTPEGVPYLAMEFVEGQPIDEYCRQRQLSLPARLELFRTVCAAVQYAHQTFVIHRDLKPGNILVTADGTPKLLDFGIAKLLDPENALGKSTLTQQLPMTPEYASPEQADGSLITTASDVYSLGVILYQLLTGQRPYEFRNRSAKEVTEVICQHEPANPSDAVRHAHADETGAGSPNKLRRALVGDLDNIVRKALRKEPEARYQSVEQLAEDVRRHLEGLPVKAREGTLVYRTSKFVKRHTVALAALLVFLLLLVGFSVNRSQQTARIARERDKAEQVAAFLINLFQVSDPNEAKGNQITAREILDKGADKITAELHNQPEVQAALMHTMGQVFYNLGLDDRAIPLFEKALNIRQQVLGKLNLETADTRSSLALALARKRDSSSVAEPLLREALEVQRKLLGQEHQHIATTMSTLASLLTKKQEFEAAELMHKEALAMRRKLLGNDHPDVTESLNLLAEVYHAKNDLTGIESVCREVLARRRKEHGNTPHLNLAGGLNDLAWLLKEKKNYAESEALFRECIEVLKKLYPDGHPHVAYTITGLGLLLTETGNASAGEPFLREALEILRRFLPPHAWDIAMGESNLGFCLTTQRRFTEAEQLLLNSLPRIRARGDQEKRTPYAIQRVVDLYQAWGKPKEAAKYRALLTQITKPSPSVSGGN